MPTPGPSWLNCTQTPNRWFWWLTKLLHFDAVLSITLIEEGKGNGSFALFYVNSKFKGSLMKRVSWIILLLVFVLALAACGDDEPEATVAAPTAVAESA